VKGSRLEAIFTLRFGHACNLDITLLPFTLLTFGS